MQQVLYSKYRPQTFGEIIGQKQVTTLLQNAVKNGNLAHAYLFVGSRGTGKTSMARILTKAINCENPSKVGEPCNECSTCCSINEGSFLDLIEIDAASNRGIDKIRELKERIEFQPSVGKFKVYIIDEVHMLTSYAFNALLKTLEEPPEHVIFILATTDPYRLPATILSRCQRYDFRLGTDDQIRKVLKNTVKKEKIKLDKEAGEILVRSAQGSYRDALSLLEVVINGIKGKRQISADLVRSVLGMPSRVMVVEFFNRIVDGQTVGALKLIQELESRGINLQQFIKYTLELLREVLVGKISGNLDETKYPFVSALSVKSVLLVINSFLEADKKLRYATVPAMILEMLVPELVDLLGTSNLSGDPVMDNEDDEEVGDTSGGSVDTDGVAGAGKGEGRSVEVAKKEEENTKESNVVYDDTDKEMYVKIKKNWAKITDYVKNVNGHLYAVIKSAVLKSVKDSVLQMEVKYKFHKERMECPNGRLLLGAAFQHGLGISVRYECAVADDNTSLQRNIQENGVPEGFEKRCTSSDEQSVSKSQKKDSDLKSIGDTVTEHLGQTTDEIFAGF